MQIKRESGLAPSNQPLWFKHMDPASSETRKMSNMMIVIVTKKTNVKLQFKLTNRSRKLEINMWIVQMTNTKILLKGLKMGLK